MNQLFTVSLVVVTTTGTHLTTGRTGWTLSMMGKSSVPAVTWAIWLTRAPPVVPPFHLSTPLTMHVVRPFISP